MMVRHVRVILVAVLVAASLAAAPAAAQTSTPDPDSTPDPTPTTYLTQLGASIGDTDLGTNNIYAMSLSADGTRVAVGEHGYEECCLEDAGRVRVFELNDDTGWVQVGSDLIGGTADGEFGYSVSLSADGTRLAVGARKSGSRKFGEVHVYDWTDATEAEAAKWTELSMPVPTAGNPLTLRSEFGVIVALSDDGTRLAAGAPGAVSRLGRAWVFDWNSVTLAWDVVGIDTGDVSNGFFGESLSLSADGSTLAVATKLPGTVYLYDIVDDIDNGLVLREPFFAGVNDEGVLISGVANVANQRRSTAAVSLSADGNRIAVEDQDGPNGRVQVYDWNGADADLPWTKVGANIDGTVMDDRFGWAASLSADGNRLAVGHPNELENVGEETTIPGRVHVYDWDGSAWTEVDVALNGELVDDQFGLGVSLSADGMRLAVAAPGDSASEAGKVSIFSLSVIDPSLPTTTTTVPPPSVIDPPACVEGASFVHGFGDVDSGSYANSAVGCLKELGVTTGTSSTTYSPLRTVTREEMAAFLARLYRKVTGEDCVFTDSGFGDVGSDSYANSDVGCLKSLNVTTGTSLTTYSPKRTVTREETALFLERLYEKVTDQECGSAESGFTDVGSLSAEAQDAISCLKSLEVTTGTTPTTYSPQRTTTREQMAAFLARMYRKLFLALASA